MTAPAKRAAPRKRATPRKRPATKTVDAAPEAEGTAAKASAPAEPSLYPKGTPLFEFTTQSGAKIIFPKITTRTPDRMFFFRLWQLEAVFQGFEWMDYYDVPKGMQALAVSLPDDEYDALFKGWYAEAELTPGE